MRQEPWTWQPLQTLIVHRIPQCQPCAEIAGNTREQHTSSCQGQLYLGLHRCTEGCRAWCRFHQTNRYLVRPGDRISRHQYPFERPALRDLAGKYCRYLRAADTNSSGAGPGLSIVKTISQSHAASVELSESQLGGPCVTIRFNLA